MEPTIDEYSGKEIRKTDNSMREDDILSPQPAEDLPLDPATGLPLWWVETRERRMGQD